MSKISGWLGVLLLTLALGACAELDTPTPVPNAAPTATASVSTVATVATSITSSPTSAPSITASVATPATTTALSPNATATATRSSVATPTLIIISPTASSTQAVANPSAANVIVAPTPTAESASKATNPPVSATSPAATATSAPAFTPNLVANGPDAEEQAFLQQLNDYRKSNGRGQLSFDSQLFQSARWMAQDMAKNNYVAHTDSQGRDIFKRIKAFGYPGSWTGENIAGGFERAGDNLKIWQSDDLHKNNLLGANYTRAGVARAYEKKSLNGWYWVLDLG